MKKTQIFALIIFILLAGSAWLFLSPAVSEIREVRQKIRQAKSRVEELRRISLQSEDMEKKTAFFQRDIQYLTRYLPGQGGINGTLNDIRSKGIGYGLNMVKADCDYSFMLEGPGASNAAAVLCLETIPFNLQIEGPLPDICSYLEWLEGLPCFLGIGNLEVSRIGNSSSAFPLLRVNMLLNVLGFSRKEKESVGHLPRESDRYYPVRLSSDLVYAQKNLRITALEKDLFSPEWVEGETVGGGDGETGRQGEGVTAEDVDSESLRGEKGAVSIADLDLNGIVSYQGEYTALIDNRRVKKGDAISGMEVMWITKDSICLSKGSDKFILRLNK